VAVADYFLKIDGIPGESVDKAHKGEIQLESFSWGESTPNLGPGSHTGGGTAAGRVQMQDMHVVARVNKASPVLMLACASGKHIKSAVLTVRRTGKQLQDFLVIKMTDLLVSSYQIGGSSASNEPPLDQISFNFASIEVDYRPQNPNGSLGAVVSGGWDVVKNVPT
jgi:type VI secretion system secreted protein Hcp